MNKYLIILLATVLTGCNSTPKMTVKEKKEAIHADRLDTLVKTVELQGINRTAFCEGSSVKTYIETGMYYNFTCMDGRSFMIPKNR